MNYRFIELSKRALYGLLLAVVCGGFTACKDDYDLDEPGNYPSFLNGPIYSTLKNPESSGLVGTFKDYIRLIDDLGQADMLDRTGSVTIFPANDEAFQRFYSNNNWGVTCYEDLTAAQKRLLLRYSMLKNAQLVTMLSNVPFSGGTTSSVDKGVAIKQTTYSALTDSIQHFIGAANFPQNNKYWERFYTRGIDMVTDGTEPMMVHLTKEYLNKNSISHLEGDANSDFAIITGTPYTTDKSYVFRNQIITPAPNLQGLTCSNGYIHQLEDVLVPPGNMAEVIRTSSNTRYFSRMLERFSAPFSDPSTTAAYNATVTEFNETAERNGSSERMTPIDTIFQKRYFSARSQGGGSLSIDPNRNRFNYLLSFDPGWNTYNTGATGSNALSDVAAMFVPTDKAMWDFFTKDTKGVNIMKRYGQHPVSEGMSEQDFLEDLDDIDINVVKDFLNNFMKASFSASVPSKFASVVKAGSGDPMGLTVNDLERDEATGKYDVRITNNGVIYMLNKVFSPDRFSAVTAPMLFAEDMNIFRDAVNDGDASEPIANYLPINLNYYAYLLAMSSNYGLLVPNDEAFGGFYLDAPYLGYSPRFLNFVYDPSVEIGNPYVRCYSYPAKKDAATGFYVRDESKDSVELAGSSFPASQFKDILNTHTIVLETGGTLETNNYYLGKNGAGLEVSVNRSGYTEDGKTFYGTIRSGAQIDNGRPVSRIVAINDQENGTTLVLDHPVETPITSVFATFYSNRNGTKLNVNTENPVKDCSRFSEFLSLCMGRLAGTTTEVRTSLLTMAYDERERAAKIPLYTIFTNNPGGVGAQKCPDMDVNFFKSYNYTVYMPNNDAMQKAYAAGLPTWNDVQAVSRDNSLSASQKQEKVRAMCEVINAFVRYHFQTNSVFVDKNIKAQECLTAALNSNSVPYRVNVSGVSGQETLRVTDNTGVTISIEKNPAKMQNQMARDFIFNDLYTRATGIVTSSFSVIHEIDTPLNPTEKSIIEEYGGTKTADGIYRYDYTFE